MLCGAPGEVAVDELPQAIAAEAVPVARAHGVDVEGEESLEAAAVVVLVRLRKLVEQLAVVDDVAREQRPALLVEERDAAPRVPWEGENAQPPDQVAVGEGPTHPHWLQPVGGRVVALMGQLLDEQSGKRAGKPQDAREG